MKKTLLLLVAVLTLVACHHEPHFITDKDYRNEVHQDFENRVSQFSILNSQLKLDTLCQTEREAMEFLYAYMPLSGSRGDAVG